ncbi:MAG: hypothetical protein ACW97P_06510 [Candidatus Hodarchaeales archaeon]
MKQSMSNEELLKLLDLPIGKIMEVVFYEALSDKEITEEELAILEGIKAKFAEIRNEYLSILTEKSHKEEITVKETEDLLYKQKAAFDEIIGEARKIAQEDGIITKDENEIFNAINETVEELISEKMDILERM